MRFFLGLVMVGLMALPAAAVTIDGSVDGAYGPALAVQDTPTGFGNNQSELNAAYGLLENGDLALMLTGNLENSSGNGLILFIDSRAGGANAGTVGAGYGVMGSVGGSRIDDWGTDTDGGAGVSPTPGGGSILDPAFNPDVALEMNIFGGTLFTNVIDLTIANVPDANKDIFLGGNATGTVPATHTYIRPDANTSKGHLGAITHVFDNSNTAGVDGGSAAGALTAMTGYEALISSEFLAADGPAVRIMAFITNGDGGFLANQFLGENGLDGAGNLGGPGGLGGTPLFDAQLFDGNQYFTVIPEPSSVALAALAMVGLAGGMRRRK